MKPTNLFAGLARHRARMRAGARPRAAAGACAARRGRGRDGRPRADRAAREPRDDGVRPALQFQRQHERRSEFAAEVASRRDERALLRSREPARADSRAREQHVSVRRAVRHVLGPARPAPDRRHAARSSAAGAARGAQVRAARPRRDRGRHGRRLVQARGRRFRVDRARPAHASALLDALDHARAARSAT